MNLKIEIIKSKFDGLEFQEYVPIDIMNRILNSDKIQPDTEEWKEKIQLLTIKKKICKNVLKVKYNCSAMELGRVSPHAKAGYCTMRRELRHTLAKNYYTDIDMVNSHPTLIYQLCESNNIVCNVLKKYVSDRDTIINQLVFENKNHTKEDIKKEIISILYGREKTELISDFLPDFIKEVKSITNFFVLANPDLVKKIEKHKKSKNKNLNNIDGSLLSYVCQHYENKILESMFFFLENNKTIIDKDCSLCYDGIMIPTKNIYANMIDELEKEVKDKTGFDIKLKIKPMNEGYTDLPEGDKEYDVLRQEFEKKHFKLMHPVSYCEITDDEQLIVRTESKFESAYRHMRLHDYKLNKKISFTSTWMNDENIKTFSRLDFLPKIEAPPDVYNTFNGFEIEKIIEKEKTKDDDIDVKVEKKLDLKDSLIYKHLHNICGNNEKVFEYVCMMLSRKLKQPTKLTNTSLLFKSKQGSGKDTFFNWFGRNILGEKYYFNSSNTELIFGRFNGSIDNKIIVVVNESNGGKNFVINDTIKDMITNKNINIEFKGEEAIKKTNCILFVYFSNNDNPLQIPLDDRRFVVIECNNSFINKADYFNPLYKEMNSRKYDRLMYDYFMSLDSDTFDFSDRPVTEAYNDMKEANKPVLLTFLEKLLGDHNSRKLLGDHNSTKDEKDSHEISSSSLFTQFNDYVKRYNFKTEMTLTKFGLKMKEYSNEIVKKHTRTGCVYTIDYKSLEKLFLDKGYIKYD